MRLKGLRFRYEVRRAKCTARRLTRIHKTPLPRAAVNSGPQNSKGPPFRSAENPARKKLRGATLVGPPAPQIALFLCLLEPLVHLGPVHHVPPRRQVLRPPVVVLQV